MLLSTSNNNREPIASNNNSGSLNEKNQIFSNIQPLCNDLGISFADLMYLQTKLSYLRNNNRIGAKYTFSDLDDTLLSRLPQVGQDQFAKNRGVEGNKVVYSMGLTNYTERYY
ncbi:MAG: hypothetical protein GY828_02825, partial [Candidatus Gracilibacteria bacterium]|nr:hypothetical protein [Candidatus Gracilibacteria bacterium]